jgi:hypothetical protein
MPWSEIDPRPAAQSPAAHFARSPRRRPIAKAFWRHRTISADLLAATLFFSVAVMFWR